MPNQIYKTVSFRKPTERQLSIPARSVQPIGTKEAKGVEDQLNAWGTADWKRPSNDELLGFLRAKLGDKRQIQLDKLSALALALVRRRDRSTGTHVGIKAIALDGRTLRLSHSARQTLFADVLATASEGSPQGIHSEAYLDAVRAAAMLWRREAPTSEEKASDALKSLVGSASLLAKGAPERDPLVEYQSLRVPKAFWVPASSQRDECHSLKYLAQLVQGGMSRPDACRAVWRALEELVDHFRRKMSRWKVQTAVKDPPTHGSVFPFLLARREASTRTASRTFAPEYDNFPAVRDSVHEQWANIADKEFKSLASDIVPKKVDEEELLWAKIRKEAACLARACQSRHPPDTYIPPDKPCVTSIGVGDLFVVEEEWLGNVAREISYIENARGGESRVRIHERETEEITYEEVERTTEESRSDSLQSADRFELQATVERQISLEVGINANVNTSGTYGVTSVETSAGATFGFSRTEASSSTVSRARDTISKATTEIRNEVREKLATTLRERTLARNEHRFEASMDNSSVFRFVEKKYRVQVKQFGARLFLEFIVPEPGRTLLEKTLLTHGLDDFTLLPKDIQYDTMLLSIGSGFDEQPVLNPNHYTSLQAKYDARGIEPPPRPITLDVGLKLETTDYYAVAEETVNVPDGYRTTDFRLFATYPDHYYVAANGRPLYSDPPGSWGTLEGLAGEIADSGLVVSASFMVPSGYSKSFKGFTNISFILNPTNDRLHQWRMDTWLRLREGYTNQLAEAEARLEEETTGLSVEEPPARLRAKEQAELQRAILYLVTGKSPDYNLVQPEPSIPGEYNFYHPSGCDKRKQTEQSFLDEAFEWHDMLSFYMPYMFGEQEAWSRRLNLRTIDEKHRQFLFAGSARVMLPVTPGHEAKVLEFLDTPIALQDDFFARLEADNSDVAFVDGLPDISTDILREILSERNDQYRIGAGTLLINGDSFTVQPQVGLEQLSWILDERIDVGREVLIEGTAYIVAEVVSETQGRFTEDTARVGQVLYYLGSVRVGDSWIEYIPTPLVILGGQEYKLGEIDGTYEPCHPLAVDAARDAALSASLSAASDPDATIEPEHTEAMRRAEERHRHLFRESTRMSQEQAKRLVEQSDERLKELDALANKAKEAKEGASKSSGSLPDAS